MVGVVLCIIWCLTASLASPGEMPGAPLSQLWQSNMFLLLPKIAPRWESLLQEIHMVSPERRPIRYSRSHFKGSHMDPGTVSISQGYCKDSHWWNGHLWLLPVQPSFHIQHTDVPLGQASPSPLPLSGHEFGWGWCTSLSSPSIHTLSVVTWPRGSQSEHPSSGPQGLV